MKLRTIRGRETCANCRARAAIGALEMKGLELHLCEHCFQEVYRQLAELLKKDDAHATYPD